MSAPLPSTALAQVFAQLDAQTSARAAAVCTDWKKVADADDRVWRDKFIEEFPGKGADPRLSLKAAYEDAVAQRDAPPRRAVGELDTLVSMTHRAVNTADMAQGLHDLIDGVIVVGVVPVHVGVACARAYVLTWINAPAEGAARGRKKVCRPRGADNNLRVFENISGTLMGAGFALGAAPFNAVLVASKKGIDTFRDDMTYAATRIPRGLTMYMHLKLRVVDIDDTKQRLLDECDALILERAQSARIEEA